MSLRRCLLGVSLLVGGCVSYGSAVPAGDVRYAPYAGPVRVTAGQVPTGAVLAGYVEARGLPNIEQAVPEFVSRVQSLGGNVGRIDRFETRFMMVTEPFQQAYNCGSARFPMTCYQTQMRTYEAATVHLEGRAFRVGMAP